MDDRKPRVHIDNALAKNTGAMMQLTKSSASSCRNTQKLGCRQNSHNTFQTSTVTMRLTKFGASSCKELLSCRQNSHSNVNSRVVEGADVASVDKALRLKLLGR
jgi:hypothetical protein